MDGIATRPATTHAMSFFRVGRRGLALLYERYLRVPASLFFVDIAGPDPRYGYREFAQRCRYEASLWAVQDKEVLTGYFLLADIDASLGMASVHLGFFDKCPETDSAAAASLAADLKRACRQAGVSRLQLLVMPWEEEKLALAEEIGFKQEGLLREHYFHDGRYHDLIALAWVDESRDGE